MPSVIENIIENISTETLNKFMRDKAGDYTPSQKNFSCDDDNADALFPPVFQEYFRSFSICGYSPSLDLFVFLIQLNNGKELGERSCRKLQFEYAKTILNKSWKNSNVLSAITNWIQKEELRPAFLTHAIFIFADAEKHFRFSLVENSDLNSNVPKRFRRYTFYVDPSATNRTFKERMAMDWSTFDKIKEAFSVERLSDEFFDEYKRIYQDFVEYATGKREIISQFSQFDDGEKALRDYVKKMMGRLVFLQFLQKKGWLGVPKDGNWGDGDKNYLQNLFRSKSDEDKENFLDAVLEPLFFDTLNTDRSKKGDVAADVLSAERGNKIRIPYLNGGLFEKDALDETKVQFPPEKFEELFETFDRFNFTIDENDPDDAEIGIDPEMLGRIFENLLEDNKDKGAFYTPKEIVSYMCQESLIQYLGDTDGNRKLVTELDADAVPEVQRQSLIEKLKAVKICDPAIGSGAFPMGMLNLLLRLRIKLGDVDDSSEGMLKAKKEIIQNNIYGVDIEAGAVDIARLRFWLSIVVDEDTPTPLPNFDYKIMQGNSLLEQYHGVDLKLDLRPTDKKGKKINTALVDRQMCFAWDDEVKALENLKSAMNDFFDPAPGENKIAIRNNIDLAVKNYIKTKCGNDPQINADVDSMDLSNKPFFLWHLFFADVFHTGGFDIVIGNPPYVSTKGRTAEETVILQSAYGFADDLYYHFVLLGFELLKPNGIQTMITSDTYFNTLTKAGLREKLLQNTLLQLTHWGHDIFNSAMVSTATFISQKCLPGKDHRVKVVDVKGKKSFAEGICFQVQQSVYKTSINKAFFIPNQLNLQINDLFAKRHTKLLSSWWDRICTSRKITSNTNLLSEYRNTLHPGMLTLVGLVTDGGQGLATANNGKYVGVFSHTEAAANIRMSRIKKLNEFNQKYRTNFQLPDTELGIWRLFDDLKLKYGRDCFGQGYIFRIVPDSMIADVSKLTEDDKVHGIKSSASFVPYDKGDKGGNRWYLETPYLIDWSQENVSILSKDPRARFQNTKFYFKEGFCYSDIKTFFIRCRQKGISVHDIKSMSLFPLSDKLPYYYIISVINSHFTATVVYNFLNNTPSFQINDCRMLPIIVPTEDQLKKCKDLFDQAITIQKEFFANRISSDIRDSRLLEIQDSIDALVYSIYAIETREYLAHTNTVYSISDDALEEDTAAKTKSKGKHKEKSSQAESEVESAVDDEHDEDNERS